MKTIRELWNEQADEWNQFDEIGKDEVEDFANKIFSSIAAKIYEEMITKQDKKVNKYFDIIEAAKKWCKENGHDGFYCTTAGESCGCSVDDLCPCGCEASLYNGDCAGGKKYVGNFIDLDGNLCDWAIAPHDWKPEGEQ